MKKLERRNVMVWLGAEDWSILNGICNATRATKAEVVRWALRQYALTGPWTGQASAARQHVFDHVVELTVGPNVKEVP